MTNFQLLLQSMISRIFYRQCYGSKSYDALKKCCLNSSDSYLPASVILLLFLSLQSPLSAQVFPVSLTTQAIPPHTGNISDWTAPGSNRLAVNILLKDVNEVNYQARLKVRIEGQGITLRSRNDVILPPIELRYGAPKQLTSPDLASVLHYENLNFENYSLQLYEANGGLPDGIYQVCFQVFDYDRVDGEPASMESCVTVFAALHKTPVIIAPIGEVNPRYPQFVPVQWHARHHSTFPTQYRVAIYEYDPASGMTPELIIDYEQPFVSKKVMSMTSSIIDISDPQLIPGRQYIIRVQAEDITRQNGFKNNGWSDFEIFKYGKDECPPPFNVRVGDLGAESATINWNPVPGGFSNSYVIKYRNKNKANSEWYEDETTGTEWTIDNLRENTTYEYQVYTLCGGNTPGALSPLDTFVTDTLPAQIDCGDFLTQPEITNRTPIDSLQKDMAITIGGFKIYLDSVSMESGRWSGNGSAHIPWINSYINVALNQVAVNTDGEVFAGSIQAVSKGLDALPGFVTASQLAAERNTAPVEICDTGNPVGEENQEDNSNENSGGDDGNEINHSAEEEYIFVAGAGIGATDLPFGLTSGSSNNTYIIALDSMVFTPQGATLKAYIALDVPSGGGDQKHLVFTGSTSFHPAGLVGTSKLFLKETVQAQLQAKTRFSFIGGNNSYVSWDCHGFQSVSLEGSVEFCRDMIIPINPATGEADSTAYVKGSFVTTMPEWGQFTATISVSPFAMTQLPDWKWEVQHMVFDYSDVTTPGVVQFPDNYEHADVIDSLAEDNYPAWTGFFLEAATVTLPNSLTGVEEGDEVTIGGKNIIIDNTGFSAWIYGTELLPLEKGRMGTWAFAIDSLGLEIQSSQFENVAFSGEVEVPAFKKPFGYECYIDPMDEYFFKVIWNDTLTLDAFKAKVEIHASSSIELQYNQQEKKYYSEAVLHGLASFEPKTSGGNGLNVPRLRFQHLKLMTKSPYVDIGDWALEGEVGAQFGNFKITICGFDMVRDPQTNEIIIGFCVKVHLTGSGGEELAGDGYFRIIADVQYSDALRRQIWAYKDFKIDKLGIDASGSGYAFSGDVEFFEKDPVYGNGFRGAIEATFEPKLTVGAVAQFGEVAGYKYFFADALASYNPGVAIGTSGLMLYGFGGGASYHMARSGFEKIVMPQEGNNPVPPEGIGVSLSGMKYIPKKEVGLGIKATVALGTVNPTLFNGLATLEFIFNTGGGLHQIGFDGTGKFLTQPASDPQLSCNLLMTYDFPEKAFHGELDIFVNVQNQITGAYQGNYAGKGTLHIDPKDWYIYLGTPDAPIALALNTATVPKLDPLDISFGGYFDAGSEIPDFPGLPSEVTNVLGEYNVTKRDDPRFAGGNGILFGANIQAELANLNYAFFYASLKAGAGWDMMMYDFGQNARCAHNATAAEPIGIDGWYGTGQMYAYLQGAVGIYVDLFLVSGRFKILDIGAAAALQARLPNPMYMKGKVGGYFNILGGLVSGNCNFKFEAGEECTVVGQDVLGVDIIADTSPNKNKNKEVDVFIRPQVTFNFAMEEEFSMYDEENKLHSYRALLDHFSIINNKTGAKVSGDLVWSNDRFTLGFKTTDILDPNTEFTMKVRVKVETKTFNTDWKTLEDTFGDPYVQSKEITFVTGDAPNYIPMENVAFSYPIHSQYHYLPEQSTQGYIQLIQGQDYLFDGTNSGEWVQKVRLIQNGRILQQYDLSYDGNQNRISFALPPENLKASTISQLVMVAIPNSSDAAVDANVSMKETTFVYNQGGENSTAGADEDFTSILLKQRALENQAQNLNEEIMLALNFRTSQFRTLREKMTALQVLRDWKTHIMISGTINEDGTERGLWMQQFGLDWTGTELFDKFEMHGYVNPAGHFIEPLIELAADLSTTGEQNNLAWYQDVIYERMTKDFPNNNYPVTWRDPARYGQIPTRAITLQQANPYNDKVLTNQEVQHNTASFHPASTRLTYKMPYFLLRDYYQFRQDIASTYGNRQMPASIKSFFVWDFVAPFKGGYQFKLRYKKPGMPAEGDLEQTIQFD